MVNTMNLRPLAQTLVMTVLSLAVAIALAGCGESGGESAGDATTVAKTTTDSAPTRTAATNESPMTSGRSPAGAKAPSDEPAGIGAKIVFNETVHDFGTIWDIEKQSHEFEFTNTGDETLVIDPNIKTSCGCTAGKPDKYEYAPGESGAIGVSFKPKGDGPQTKNLTIKSNAVNAPTQTLYIKSNIRQFVTAEPHILQMGTVHKGEAHTQSVLLTSVDPDFQIIDIKPNTPIISAHVAGDAAGPSMPDASSDQPKEIVVTLTEDAPWGQFFGAITVTTRGRLTPQSELIDHDVTVPVNATVFGAVRVNPPYFRVAIVPPGDDFDATVELISMSGKPFELTSVELVGPAPTTMSVDVEPLNEGKKVGYRLLLTGQSGDYMGTLRGNVRVITDIPGEDPLFIRVAGIVRDPNKPFQ